MNFRSWRPLFHEIDRWYSSIINYIGTNITHNTTITIVWWRSFITIFTPCGLVTPYIVISLGHHCHRLWLGFIIWSNVDSSSNVFCGIDRKCSWTQSITCVRRLHIHFPHISRVQSNYCCSVDVASNILSPLDQVGITELWDTPMGVVHYIFIFCRIFLKFCYCNCELYQISNKSDYQLYQRQKVWQAILIFVIVMSNF